MKFIAFYAGCFIAYAIMCGLDGFYYLSGLCVFTASVWTTYGLYKIKAANERSG